tara:strand:- start:418 stop:636 length:219 start_codon:yes stop_codon:yes gene_type:complete
MNSLTKELSVAYKICEDIIDIFPDKSLDEFLDMIEYPGFLLDVEPDVILYAAHRVYSEHMRFTLVAHKDYGV